MLYQVCCTEISSREAWGKLSAFDSVHCLPSQIDAHVPRNGGMRHSHGGKEHLFIVISHQLQAEVRRWGVQPYIVLSMFCEC